MAAFCHSPPDFHHLPVQPNNIDPDPRVLGIL
jgi:hypothetical protein